MRMKSYHALLSTALLLALASGAAAQEFRATVAFTSPTAYRAMLGKAGAFDLSSLRKCVSAGETLPASTFEAAGA